MFYSSPNWDRVWHWPHCCGNGGHFLFVNHDSLKRLYPRPASLAIRLCIGFANKHFDASIPITEGTRTGVNRLAKTRFPIFANIKWAHRHHARHKRPAPRRVVLEIRPPPKPCRLRCGIAAAVESHAPSGTRQGRGWVGPRGRGSRVQGGYPDPARSNLGLCQGGDCATTSSVRDRRRAVGGPPMLLTPLAAQPSHPKPSRRATII